MLKIETVIKVHMYCIPKFPDQNVQIDSHTKVKKNIHKIKKEINTILNQFVHSLLKSLH